MQAVVRISRNLEEEPVKKYLSGLRIPLMSIDPVFVGANVVPTSVNDPEIFFLDVSPGGIDFDNQVAEDILYNHESSLLLFNPEAPVLDEPKVIYLTDHSEQANANLEVFKQLKPKGFPGATVISENESFSTQAAWKDIAKQILNTTRSAVQSSRANLIIANFDLTQSTRRTSRLECLAHLVEQNLCHILILKA